MQAALTPGRRTALWLALAATIFPSAALELGPAQVQSALGEKLDARIPVRAREGEWFHAKCLALTPGAIPGVAALTGGTLSVERRRTTTNLRIRSAEPVQEPALAFGVTSSCAGEPQPLGAPIALLIDPPRVDRAPRKAEAVPPAAARPTPSREARPPRAQPASPAALAQAPVARPTPVPSSTDAPPAAVAASATKGPAPQRAASPTPQATPAPSRAAREGDFVLRLSSAPIDLARTRRFDEKSRALLRERLRLLDSDDQVAEMLSMRDNLRRLEARVAELQLKLAAMPQSFPAPRAEAPAAKESAKPVAPVPAAKEAEKPVAAPIAAPAVQAPPTAAVAKTETKPAVQGSQPATPVVVAPAPPAATTQTPKAAPAPVAEESMLDSLQSFKGRLIGIGIAVLVLLGFLAAWLWSRWRNPPARDEEDQVDANGEATVIMDRDEGVAAEEPIEIASPAPVRPEVTSDASLATRLSDDSESLRQRYLEERFPEVKAGTIALRDAGSVVKGARLFYEDGAMPRAVELLRFAVEDRPAELRPWLALFEIYRLERLPGEYSELAARFKEHHGSTPQWRKVCSFGRELDPGNPLYQQPPLKSLETIGPAEARRMAQAHADPIVENWLEAPMDFENEVLATELRRTLMSGAKVEDRDLVPNPMPALRSVEMFSVG